MARALQFGRDCAEDRPDRVGFIAEKDSPLMPPISVAAGIVAGAILFILGAVSVTPCGIGLAFVLFGLGFIAIGLGSAAAGGMALLGGASATGVILIIGGLALGALGSGCHI